MVVAMMTIDRCTEDDAILEGGWSAPKTYDILTKSVEYDSIFTCLDAPLTKFRSKSRCLLRFGGGGVHLIYKQPKQLRICELQKKKLF